jgi:hypothetical protein
LLHCTDISTFPAQDSIFNSSDCDCGSFHFQIKRNMNSLYYKLLEKQKFAEFLPGRLINRSHELIISLDVQLAHNHFHNETFTVFVDILKNLQSTSCEMVECLRRNKETMSFVSVDQYVLSDLNASAARTTWFPSDCRLFASKQ